MEVEKQRKQSVLDRTAEQFDIPGNALGDQARITITGSTHVLVDNHKGLLDYGREEIAVAGKSVAIKIIGTNLELRAMNTESLLVTGEIFQVAFVY